VIAAHHKQWTFSSYVTAEGNSILSTILLLTFTFFALNSGTKKLHFTMQCPTWKFCRLSIPQPEQFRPVFKEFAPELPQIAQALLADL
jgi:hypothetical protein